MWKDDGGGWKRQARFIDAVKEEMKSEPVSEKRMQRRQTIGRGRHRRERKRKNESLFCQ